MGKKPNVKEFFRTRSVVFYVAVAAAGLSIILSIVYAACYANTRYMSWAAFVLTLLSGFVFAGLAAFKQTEAFSAMAMGLLNFIAFILFIYNVYMYFSVIFYGGFKASDLGKIDPAFYVCTIFYLTIIIASNVCAYLKISKKAKIVEITGNEQPEAAEEAEQV